MDIGPPAGPTWCLTPRNPLFLRPGAPRPSGPAGRRRIGRGASLLAIHYSFVQGHHVHGVQRADGEPDVVFRSPQSLIPSSRGTTSTGFDGPTAGQTWCFTARKPLFLRPGAPRPRGQTGLRQARRGASLPAIPCFFVQGHHVHGVQRADGRSDVVPHSPQSLIPSSTGTTSSQPGGPSTSDRHRSRPGQRCRPLLSPLKKAKRKRHPRRRFPLLPLFEGNPRPGISDCSFPRKTHRHPGGVFRQKFPFLFLQGNFRHVFPEGLPANTPNGTPEKIPISPSLPTSFPSAGRSLPCRRYWRKPSRSRFCPGSGQPSSSPARNPHRPCRNPFSPPR